MTEDKVTVTVIGDCGPHRTIEEWSKCVRCAAIGESRKPHGFKPRVSICDGELKTED